MSDPPFGHQISAQKGPFLAGFLGHKFHTRLEDSGFFRNRVVDLARCFKPPGPLVSPIFRSRLVPSVADTSRTCRGDKSATSHKDQ